MANQEQLEILKSGVEKWNKWRKENPDKEPNLIMAYLRKSDLRKANLSGACLRGADLSSSFLEKADLRKVDLNRADLREANLCGANLRKANLRKADLKRTDLSGVDLSQSYLREATLREAFLRGAILNKADLREANLREADLRETNLSETNLSGALLIGTNLSKANLSNIDLSGANLSWAIFNETKLFKANLDNVHFGYTYFANVDLTDVINLERCIHFGNSYIDYHSLSKSKNLSESFLRGCGLSDEFIKTIPSLFNKPLQFYYCFISYSTKDQEFADRLFADLQNKGIRAWFAPHDLLPGEKIIDQIDAGIKVTDKLLLILSENSIGSNWVKTEITKAYDKSEQIGKQVLFPISITDFKNLKKWEYFDSDHGKDLAKELREFYLLDFEDWKDHDTYNKCFEKLVESLRIKNEI